MQFCHIMTTVGIVAGLLAATFQSLSYLFSRGFVMHKLGSPLDLVLVSQVYMAALCLPVVFVAYHTETPALSHYALPLVLSTAFYVVGQASIFIVMREIQASRVAPMLGFKIVILALIAWFAPGSTVLPRQWLGVGVATLAVALLNFSGGRLPLKSTLALLTACVAYSLSDTFIRALVLSLEPVPVIHASILATCISYILCGAVSLPIILVTGRRSMFRTGVRFSLPYAVCWLTGMFALFTAFATVGTVLGNILQSSRGIISILISIPAVKLGFARIEPAVARKVIVQRLSAALLIVTAVWLYASK